MLESTTIVAFDQHAATTVAAVLLPGQRTPALHPLTSDLPTIRRFVERLQRQGAVRCCYEAGPCGFELQRALTAHADPVRRDRAGVDSAAPRRSDQDRSARRGPAGGALSRRRADRDSHPDRAGGSGARSAALPRRHPRRSAARAASALEVPAAPWPALHRHQEGVDEAARHVAARADVAAPGARPDARAYLRAVDEVVARLRDRRDRSAGPAHARAAAGPRRSACAASAASTISRR